MNTIQSPDSDEYGTYLIINIQISVFIIKTREKKQIKWHDVEIIMSL